MTFFFQVRFLSALSALRQPLTLQPPSQDGSEVAYT